MSSIADLLGVLAVAALITLSPVAVLAVYRWVRRGR